MFKLLLNNRPCWWTHWSYRASRYSRTTRNSRTSRSNWSNRSNGPQGLQGIQGLTGPTGATGPAGPSSGILNYADFYILMPQDNAATVASGTDVSFSQNGPNNGTSITRTDASSFNLTNIGIYQIYFNIPITETGQLELTLNGTPLPYIVVGRATGTSNITGMFIVETTSVNSVISVRNTAGNAAALTITPLAGGTSPD